MPRRLLFNFVRSLGTSRNAMVGGGIVIVLFGTAIMIALTGYSLLPYNPIEQDVGAALDSPSSAHIFGTDQLGRDVFSRVIYASLNDAFVSIAVVGTSFMIGALLGSYAGYKGGLIDEILMRLADTVFALPSLLLAMAISVTIGGGVTNMMFALIIVWWPPYARMFRGEALRVSQYAFVEASKACGLGTARVIIKHVLPNILTTMVVYATLDVGTVILVYSGLSYLGLSVKPPWPDWGEMVASYQNYALAAPWLPLFPGLVIAAIAIGFSLFGDGMRDILEAGRL